MSGFDTGSTFDMPRKHTISEQRQQQFAEFDNEQINNALAKEAEAWVSFGVSQNDSQQHQNELSPTTSMKVQLGQADTYESTDIDKIGDFNDDTVTSTTDYDDDTDYGPEPIADVFGAEAQTTGGGNDVIVEKSVASSSKNSTTGSHILMLVTNMGMNRTQVQNQQRASMMLNSRKIIYESIDGSDPSNKDVRNELFGISDIRGSYPQFFVVTDDEERPQISFLGDFETIEGINDSSGLPVEILEANPTIVTWNRIPQLSYRK